eukprot:TRINITY_DN21298_c0_g1_i1.p1 TRINITY_DN21298_c0_g1~~TRINITY_DN21298_c0_g1_i1.p1  ORF type:complete len:175 (+),score=39.73 TRINITY_DN21298_c0_g1_i1:37-561(+)
MDRRVSKKKLSKHLLEMKFMKRTKEKKELQDEEEIRSQMFDAEVTPAMRVEGDRFMIESSYGPIENLKFGRLSFKGMNPEIETIMLEDAARDENTKQEMEVSDQEMADRYANLVGTMQKKFATKRDAEGKRAGPVSSPSTSKLIAQTSSFLAQVRKESDQSQAKKPNFQKPSED